MSMDTVSFELWIVTAGERSMMWHSADGIDQALEIAHRDKECLEFGEQFELVRVMRATLGCVGEPKNA